MTKTNLIYLLLISGFVITTLVWVAGRATGGTFSLAEQVPCERPLSWGIGEIDTRFAITEQDVRNSMSKAAAAWSAAAGFTVAEKNEEPEIIINFNYAREQKLADNELRAREEIRTEQNRIDRLQHQYDNRREEFDRRSAEYLILAEETTGKIDKLNTWINEINRTGGFTGETVNEYEKRKSVTERLQQRVLQERAELDRIANRINQISDRLNEKVARNNLLIDRYNEQFAGENRFTKATFQRNGNSGVITVNQFLSKNELPLILAHELGHAMGLYHVDNPKSVMFRRMGTQQYYPHIQLTEEDILALQNRCR